MTNPAIAYKVLTPDQHAALVADGSFRGSAADLRDGFVHLSTAAQLAGTLDRHYAGQSGLIIAAIDLARCGKAIRWEVSRGGGLFPQLYGVLDSGAIVAQCPLERTADGGVVLPG